MHRSRLSVAFLAKATARRVLSTPGRSQHQEVGRLGDGGQVGQFLNLPVVDRRLEGGIELLKGALEEEVGHLGPGAEVALPAGLHLGAQ